MANKYFFKTRHCLLSISILFIFNLGCQQKRDSDSYFSYEDFPNKLFFNSTEIPLDTILFRYPFRINVFEDKAIILDLHNQDHYYHVFTYPNFKPLVSFGRKGNASDEVLSGENLCFINDDTIFTLDANKREIQHWRLFNGKNSVELLKTIPLENELLRALDFARINDSVFAIPDYTGKNRFCLINTMGQSISHYGKIPTEHGLKKDNFSPALAQAWRSFIGFNPKNNVLAMVTQFGEVLEVFHLGEDSISQFITVGPHGIPVFEEFKGQAIPTGIMGFSDVYVAEEYIYAVFHGQSFKEMYLQGNNAVDGGKYIYVFDLKGNPVCKIELDRYIYSIYFDESEEKIIALDVNSDQPIVEYKVPGNLFDLFQ